MTEYIVKHVTPPPCADEVMPLSEAIRHLRQVRNQCAANTDLISDAHVVNLSAADVRVFHQLLAATAQLFDALADTGSMGNPIPRYQPIDLVAFAARHMRALYNGFSDSAARERIEAEMQQFRDECDRALGAEARMRAQLEKAQKPASND